MESIEQRLNRLEDTIVAMQETNKSLRDLLKIINETLTHHGERLRLAEDTNIETANLLNDIVTVINSRS